MKTFRSLGAGFTLIEILVVISIMAVLAALIIPAAHKAGVYRQLRLAQVELAHVETAIEQYKTATGAYPPDNPADPAVNPLFYELEGTTNDPVNGVFQTLDGSATISVAAVPGTFGPAGFMNCSRPGSGGDNSGARHFIASLKPNQIGMATINNTAVKLLVCSVGWPASAASPPLPAQPTLNPWRYSSSKPANNSETYDLWIDLPIGGTTYRISNWSKGAQKL